MHLPVILLLSLLATVYALPIENVVVETKPQEVKSEVVVENVVQGQVPGIVVDVKGEEKEEPQVVVVNEKDVPASAEIVAVVADSSSGETTTFQPQSDSGERTARQADEDDDEEGNADEDDDEEEDDGEEEEEEEERKLPAAGKTNVKAGSKKKAATPGKPVPVLGDGVEDDEAEDLGIFEREEVKSDEKSDEKEEEDQNDDDDDESGEEDERSERPQGLVADPSSGERGDNFDAPSPPSQNEVNDSERPLAVAVVQREEESRDPVVPVIVEDTNTPLASETAQIGDREHVPKQRKNKPKKEVEEDEDDEDDDEEDEEDDPARSEKVSHARAAYPSPVLYYYPFPESSVA